MATDTQTIEEVVEAPPFLDHCYRLSIEQYQRIAEAGIIGPADRVEFIEGLLVKKMTKYPPHIIAAELLTRLMGRILPDGWFLSMENPVSIPERQSEPEPDAQVVRGDPRDYADRKHGPGDAALVIELSQSSYAFDRRCKWRLYARSSVPIYWILDLNRRLLEVFTDPTGPADEPYYRQARTYGPGDVVPLVLEGVEVARVAVDDLLP